MVIVLALCCVSPTFADLEVSPDGGGGITITVPYPVLHFLRVQTVEKFHPGTAAAHSLSWPLGQCTYWANLRYHELTGSWVPWMGNADAWVTGARRFGWNVSSLPRAPSILVLMPGVQGASSIGHVAVVESILSPTTFSTSNMNWNGWDIVRNVTFHTGPGVWFVWR